MVALANGFALRGYKVDLVLARAEGPYLRQVSDAVTIIDLGKDRVIFSLIPLARYLRRARPTAMLSAMNRANVVAILGRKLARASTRLIVSEHNSLTQRHPGLSGLVIRILMRYFYPSSDGVVCVSNGIAESMPSALGVSASHISTIYNPVDIGEFRGQMEPAPNHPWMSGTSSKLLLAVGRLSRQKDYPTLLRAFARLRADRDAKLIILGQGELEGHLRAMSRELGIDEYVDFVGYQMNPAAWMVRCDLFVLSSAWEGFGNVLVEAMACGARVVSTACPSGPDEILEEGRWGRLVPVGDADAFQKAMAEALDDEVTPDYTHTLKRFESDRIIEQYLAILNVKV